MARQDLIEVLRRNFDDSTGVNRGDDLFRPDVTYAPHSFVSKGEKGKHKFRRVTKTDFFSSPELNPSHLTEAGIQSGIDHETQNVVYSVPDAMPGFYPNGKLTIGFYDRANAASANQKAASGNDPGLGGLVANTDPDLPKLQLLERLEDLDVLRGRNFPGMFNYRSVLFSRDTTYGIVIAVDQSVVGVRHDAQDVLIDEKYIERHPEDLNYLLPLLIEAAAKQGISFGELSLSKQIDVETRDLISMRLKEFQPTVSYTRTPLVGIAVRHNGMPVGLAVDERGEEPHFYEILSGAKLIGDRYIGVVSGAVIQNPAIPAESVRGDLMYKVITRGESIGEMAENERFGMLDIHVLRGYEIGDFSVDFKQTQDTNALLGLSQDFRDFDRGSVMKGGHTLGLGGYTAGRSSVGNVQTARVETKGFHFGGVILRDAFCLINMERNPRAREYKTE